MNTDNENDDIENDDIDTGTDTPTGSRPLGYWLRTVDSLLTREFAAAFETEGISRRDWMLLNVLTGDVRAPGFAERLARKGKRLRRLEELGWAEEQGDGTWTVTDEGRAAKERLGAVVDGIRSRVAGAVSPEDFATTLTSLEAIARELGWDESMRFPRGRGFGPGRRGGSWPFRPEIRFGFGPNLHHGFEPGRPGRPGTDPRHGTSHGAAWHGRAHEGHDGCAHDGHVEGERGHGHHEHPGRHGQGHRGHDRGHRAETAYERGFAAGFDRGRESGAA
ncbi:hypothetical protein [Microbacterium sp. CFBP9034]|uniref:MarR family winged helix-turn-helix transcriptional regulator n=1 Tax=Microbacterium sp. CFBP9034 TaxID=3096540 RepID=UPI002A6AF08C|nr:hypothetical protein [Microbacterium sp. CFBP9034]MDY0908195.1 hypothetical protein [Microbacterium sp. CFBP9034]